VRSGPGEARTILLLHIISARPSKQPLMVRTFLKVFMELGSSFLFLQEQNKRHHHHREYDRFTSLLPSFSYVSLPPCFTMSRTVATATELLKQAAVSQPEAARAAVAYTERLGSRKKFIISRKVCVCANISSHLHADIFPA